MRTEAAGKAGEEYARIRTEYRADAWLYRTVTTKELTGERKPEIGPASEISPGVPFPVSWTVKMKKKQKETQDILSYHTQAAGCSDKARAKASGGRQPIEECGRTGL